MANFDPGQYDRRPCDRCYGSGVVYPVVFRRDQLLNRQSERCTFCEDGFIWLPKTNDKGESKSEDNKEADTHDD